MTFKKGFSGNKKGRPVGSKDWRTDWTVVHDKLKKRGFDPIDALINMATDLQYDPVIRFGATKELASRVYPHLKSVDIQINPDRETEQNIIELNDFKVQMLELIESNKSEY